MKLEKLVGIGGGLPLTRENLSAHEKNVGVVEVAIDEWRPAEMKEEEIKGIPGKTKQRYEVFKKRSEITTTTRNGAKQRISKPTCRPTRLE